MQDRNNNFRKATDLGSFSSTQVLRTRNSIGSKDTADVFKFTVPPTFGFRASAVFKSKGGSLNVSFFALNPLNNQIAPIPTPISPTGAPVTFKPGKSTPPFEFPASDVPLTFFVRFDKPTADVNYRFILRPSA
jgi:hypothetical protein